MSKLFTPDYLCSVAKDFFEKAVCSANEVCSRNSNLDKTLFVNICFPITTMSFSLELALKGLLLCSEKEIYVHDLELLFNSLNAGVKNKIIEHLKTHDNFRNLINLKLKFGELSEYANGIKVIPHASTEEMVIDVLSRHKLSFNSFRYLHEFGKKIEHLDFDFHYFANIVYSTISILAEEINAPLKPI